MKDIDVNYITKMDLAPYKEEFLKTGRLSAETLEKILGRQPYLGFDSPDMDTNMLEAEDFIRWTECKGALMYRLHHESM